MAISNVHSDAGSTSDSDTCSIPGYASAADGDIVVVAMFANGGGLDGDGVAPSAPSDGRWLRMSASGGAISTYPGDYIHLWISTWSTTLSDDPFVFTDEFPATANTTDWAWCTSWYRADSGSFLSPGYCLNIAAGYYADNSSAWGFDDWFANVEAAPADVEVGDYFGQYDLVKSTVAADDMCVFMYGNQSDNTTATAEPAEPTGSTSRQYSSNGSGNLSGVVAIADESGSTAVSNYRKWQLGYTGSAKTLGVWLRESGSSGGPWGGFIAGYSAW